MRELVRWLSDTTQAASAAVTAIGSQVAKARLRRGDSASATARPTTRVAQPARLPVSANAAATGTSATAAPTRAGRDRPSDVIPSPSTRATTLVIAIAFA